MKNANFIEDQDSKLLILPNLEILYLFERIKKIFIIENENLDLIKIQGSIFKFLRKQKKNFLGSQKDQIFQLEIEKINYKIRKIESFLGVLEYFRSLDTEIYEFFNFYSSFRKKQKFLYLTGFIKKTEKYFKQIVRVESFIFRQCAKIINLINENFENQKIFVMTDLKNPPINIYDSEFDIFYFSGINGNFDFDKMNEVTVLMKECGIFYLVNSANSFCYYKIESGD